jgi:hypothetical protein
MCSYRPRLSSVQESPRKLRKPNLLFFSYEAVLSNTRRSVTFSNPENKGWNATVLPAYSGKVIVAGNNGEQLSIAYMGLSRLRH